MQIISNGDNLHPVETVCKKCQSQLPGKNKKNINLSSAELAQWVVKVNKYSQHMLLFLGFFSSEIRQILILRQDSFYLLLLLTIGQDYVLLKSNNYEK